MSLSGYWSDLLSGQSFGSTDAAQTLSDTTDAALLNQDSAYAQRQLDAGLWTQAQSDTYNATASKDIAAGNVTTGANDVAGSIDGAFVQGAKEGLAAEAGAVSGTLNGAAKGILGFAWSALPWWVWLGAIVAIFFYFGGGFLVKAEARKHFKARYGE